MGTPDFRIRLTTWTADRTALAAVRRQVFIDEQSVPEALEWDEQDALAVHVLAETAEGAAVGTGRLLPDGHVGRMAVLRSWRGRGVGRALLDSLLTQARRRGQTDVVLSAQVQAMDFYRRFGFEAEGRVFDDAGIPHRQMRLCLSPAG